MKKSEQDYQSLSHRLDEVLAALQSPDITVDEAVKLYSEGSELVEALQRYLKNAENQITKLKTQNS